MKKKNESEGREIENCNKNTPMRTYAYTPARGLTTVVCVCVLRRSSL